MSAWGRAKPLVDEAITTTLRLPRGLDAFLPCRASVVPCNPHLRHWRDPPSPQADRLVLAQAQPGAPGLLVLAYLRKGETFADLQKPGFGVSTATAWRYVSEAVRLLASRAPRLRSALRAASNDGHAYVVIYGTLIPVDRLAADRPFYSGKHKKHGMNLQVIASPDGTILWVSGPLPGSAHDLTAARIWGVLRELAATGLAVLADKGYTGAGAPVITPYRGRNKPASQKDANRAHAMLALPVSEPTPSSRPGGSCANSAAAPGGPGNSPKPSTSSRPARSQDEKGSVKWRDCIDFRLSGLTCCRWAGIEELHQLGRKRAVIRRNPLALPRQHWGQLQVTLRATPRLAVRTRWSARHGAHGGLGPQPRRHIRRAGSARQWEQ